MKRMIKKFAALLAAVMIGAAAMPAYAATAVPSAVMTASETVTAYKDLSTTYEIVKVTTSDGKVTYWLYNKKAGEKVMLMGEGESNAPSVSISNKSIILYGENNDGHETRVKLNTETDTLLPYNTKADWIDNGTTAIIRNSSGKAMGEVHGGTFVPYQRPASGPTITFYKYLLVNKNGTVPDVTFTYKLTAGDAVAKSATNPAVTSGTDADSAVVGTAAFTSADTIETTADSSVTLKNWQGYVKKPVTIDMSKIMYRPGVYRYVLTEEKVSGRNDIAYDVQNDGGTECVRYLDIYVGNSETKNSQGRYDLKILSSVLHTTPSADVPISTNSSTSSSAAAVSDKSDGFVNEVIADKTLTIKKKVSGSQASRDKYFKFHLDLSNVGGSVKIDYTNADTVTGSNAATLDAYEGITQPTTVSITDGKGSTDFYLRNDQSVVITLPAGSAYTVTETEEDYTPEVERETEGSTTTMTRSGDTYSATGITSNTTLTFTNTKDAAVPTGIAMNVMPYIIAAVIAAAAIGFAAAKKRKQ